MRQQTPRVVVGVDDSLAGLRALREAVGIARRRRMDLVAVRAAPPPPPGPGSWAWPIGAFGVAPAASGADGPWRIREREVRAAVAHAFDEAMGGMPSDIRVSIVPVDVRLGRALVNTCLERDVLVIAAPRRGRWWPFRRSVVRYCTAHADAPVVAVPPPRAARELGGGWWPSRRLRRRHELTALLGERGTQAQQRR